MSVHELAAVQVGAASAYSSRYCKLGALTEPSLETCIRKRFGVFTKIALSGVSATPPVAEVAAVSLPSSFRQWKWVWVSLSFVIVLLAINPTGA